MHLKQLQKRYLNDPYYNSIVETIVHGIMKGYISLTDLSGIMHIAIEIVRDREMKLLEEMVSSVSVDE